MTHELRKSARDQECQIRIHNVCNFDPETTVLAHLPGGGMGMKSPDIHGAFCCSACHDLIDGRSRTFAYSKDELKLMHLEGVIRTQQWWLDNGYINVKD